MTTQQLPLAPATVLRCAESRCTAPVALIAHTAGLPAVPVCKTHAARYRREGYETCKIEELVPA